jgi:uncharacterized cofD-like protein
MGKAKIVTIGGGSGQFILLSGLREKADFFDITSVVSMADSGGSSGILRNELGILPPGDILKCMIALSPKCDVLKTILLKRFKKNIRLQEHNAGNMLLCMLFQYTEDIYQAIESFSEILEIKGRVCPVTVDKATLVAEFASGEKIFGESSIDLLNFGNEIIKDIYLVPHHKNKISVNPDVIKYIKQANMIVIGPGDLYTSILPNFAVPEICDAIKDSSATLVYVLNLMTKGNETFGFKGYDFIYKIEQYLGTKINKIIVNSRKPKAEILMHYKLNRSELVNIDRDDPRLEDRKIYFGDIISESKKKLTHDYKSLANIIYSLFNEKSKVTLQSMG